MLVYAAHEPQSFQVIVELKRLIDNFCAKEKRDVPTIILANKRQDAHAPIQADNVVNWCQREKGAEFYK